MAKSNDNNDDDNNDENNDNDNSNNDDKICLRCNNKLLK